MGETLKNEVAVFGRITAGVTHEMKNVLAIIREASGLIQDLMALNPEALPHGEKYQKALESISAQVQRGNDLTTRLNQFAHAPDQDLKQVDLLETTAVLLALTQRFARLKNIVMACDPSAVSGPPVLLVTHPVHLLLALFSALECWLSLAPPGSRIKIKPFRDKHDCTIAITCEGQLSETGELTRGLSETPPWPLLEEMVFKLKGRIEIDEPSACISLRLSDLQPNGAPDDRTAPRRLHES